MTERPSDDGLRDILSDDDAWVTRGEIQEMASELLALRTKLATGPVMPEVPSEAVIVAAFTYAGIPDDATDDKYRSDFKGLWSAIRAEMLKERE